MFLTLIAKEGMSTIALPEKAAGQFWLMYPQGKGQIRALSVEGIDNQWVMQSNGHARLLNNSAQAVPSAEAQPYQMYPFEMTDTGERGMIFCEPVSEDRCRFHKLTLPRRSLIIQIGRGAQNQICYREPYVSTVHARLIWENNSWRVEDGGSANGTFVNGKPVRSAALAYGDLIYILGLKIIVGDASIAFNNPGERVAFNIPGAVEAEPEPWFVQEEKTIAAEGEEKITFYSRSPRFKREIEASVFKIDSPPQNQIGQETPLFLVIGSSVSMGLMSMIMMVSAVTSGNMLSLASGLAMLLSTLMMPLITKRFEKKRRVKREALRQKKYTEYLEKIRQDILAECRRQETILRENYGPVSECEKQILQVNRSLWERDSTQNDFLTVRLGSGNGRLQAEVQFAERRFTLDDDNLQESLLQLGEADKTLQNIPVTLSLLEHYVSGVIGAPAVTLEFIKGIIIQLAAYYSYDEVKLIFLYHPERTDLSFVKWLPHVWDDEKSIRFIAASAEECRELSAYFDGIIEQRSSLQEDDRKNVLPYYVVFDMDKTLAESCDMLRQVLSKRSNLRISVLSVREDFAELPRQCSTVLQLESAESAVLFDRSNISGQVRKLQPDIYLHADALQLSKKLAGIRLAAGENKTKLPKMISFLEMYGVGKIEHLNPLVRWKENDPTKTLQAPVGVDQAGNLLSLDLHEKYHGPHGLVAGMTGSGKSEFIITYILSLAINYRPEEVAFVLIDYKGGGLTGAFEDSSRGIRLPHLVGTITNLDGAAVNRSLISIQSELRRRQAIFNEARKVSNEGTMDIYKYQKLYREGIVPEPVPHLFIISDEFAELKMQQPEFMEQLVSAARIGRSLGVHLILATQKPSGVVDDQIWSNSRFRVCLKVQDKADSMDMIKRPEAASLVETGRFYLQVGFNEFFDLGQSAWCGAPYIPSPRVQKNIDNSIRVVDRMGRTVREIKPAPQAADGLQQKQIVAIVRYLSNLAKEEKIQPRSLWLDPIPGKILTEDLKRKYNHQAEPFVLNPIIGEYDDPYNQKQALMTLPLTEEGNALIYGSTGSGKELLLHSLIYSLITGHDAREVNLYLLDFGAETLLAYAKAPQVGDVLLSSDSEKIVNLLRMLQEELTVRRRAFMDFGGDYRSYLQLSGQTLPGITVIINNYSAFAEQFEELEDALALLLREGPKYGIFFVMTVSAANAVRYRMQQNFRQMLVLQMNDPSDYTGLLGQTEGVLPSRLYGRGLVRCDRVYEFQTAHITESQGLVLFARELSERLAAQAAVTARTIPVMPDTVDAVFVADAIRTLEAVPVGIHSDSLQVQTVNLKKSVIYPVLSQDEESVAAFALGMMEVLSRMPDMAPPVLIDAARQLETERLAGCEVHQDDVEPYLGELILEVASRYNAYRKQGEEAVRNRAETVIVIAGLKALCDVLSADGQDKLRLILEKAQAEHKMHFLICDSADGWNQACITLLHKRKTANEGIWIGEGAGLQYILNLSRRTGLGETDERMCGYVIRKGKALPVKLLEPVENGEGGEADD